MTRRRVVLGVVALVVLAALGSALRFAWLAAGFAAKTAGSAVFVGGRTLDDALAHDAADFAPLFDLRIDGDRCVASFFGLFERQAVFREYRGVTLLVDGALAPVPRRPRDDAAARAIAEADVPVGPPSPALRDAVDRAFERSTTRAVVVRHRGRLVAERYADGLGPRTPMLGWSMTKSLLAAVVGVCVDRGHVALDEPLGVWSPGDERAAITVDHALRMSTGLAFDETYLNPFADAPQMLFGARSAAEYTSALPLEHAVDTVFAYSSGTSNLLVAVLAERVGGAGALLDLTDDALFAPLGMARAVWEVDASGMPIGSSFGHATARGWSRFGQLHLDDGVWNDARLLPEGWVTRVTTPTPTAPRGNYGGHWWLNAGPPGDPAARMFPSIPDDAFSAQGYAGQYLVVVPSRDAVILRLGVDSGPRFALDAFVAGVLEALPRD